MNIVLTSLSNIDLTSVISDINPCLILKSDKEMQSLRLADIAIQLDKKIHFETASIDLVCVINQPNLTLQHIKNNFVNDYADRFYYATKDLHTSSFYCKPHVFSLIGSLYKNDWNHFKNTQDDSIELLAEKILYLIVRLGVDVKFG
jgi:hypothetical protein